MHAVNKSSDVFGRVGMLETTFADSQLCFVNISRPQLNIDTSSVLRDLKHLTRICCRGIIIGRMQN